jgi:hypothetical protein
MKLKNQIIGILALILLASCASTLTVKSDSEKKAGIPFFIQKEIIQKETKYLYDWIEISLIKEESKNGKTINSTIHTSRIIKGQNIRSIEEKLIMLNNSEDEDKMVQKIILDIDNLNKVTLESTEITTNNIIENNWTKTTVIDYSTKYYVNAKMPWLGTSSLNQKLNTNGTLSESTITTDSQIDEFAGVIASLATPISNIRIADIGKEIAELGGIEEIEKAIKNGDFDFSKLIPNVTTMKYKLEIKEKGYIYIFTKQFEIEKINDVNKPIDFDIKNGNFKRISWPATSKKEEKSKKPTINISGSVELPE